MAGNSLPPSFPPHHSQRFPLLRQNSLQNMHHSHPYPVYIIYIQGLGIKSWQLFFCSHLNDDTTKYECGPASMTLVVCRHYSNYCYNTEGDRNSVVSQVSCRIDVTQCGTAVNHEMLKFTNGKAGDIQCLPHRWLRTVATLRDYFKDL